LKRIGKKSKSESRKKSASAEEVFERGILFQHGILFQCLFQSDSWVFHMKSSAKDVIQDELLKENG